MNGLSVYVSCCRVPMDHWNYLKSQAFSLLQTNSSQKWCGFFQALLEHLCDVRIHPHIPISQFSTVPCPFLCFQNKAGANMLYPFSVTLSNKATKQIQLNTEIKVQWKNIEICVEFLIFGNFSPILPHKRPPFVISTVYNII